MGKNVTEDITFPKPGNWCGSEINNRHIDCRMHGGSQRAHYPLCPDRDFNQLDLVVA